jgi:hypothetical protein
LNATATVTATATTIGTLSYKLHETVLIVRSLKMLFKILRLFRGDCCVPGREKEEDRWEGEISHH